MRAPNWNLVATRIFARLWKRLDACMGRLDALVDTEEMTGRRCNSLRTARWRLSTRRPQRRAQPSIDCRQHAAREECAARGGCVRCLFQRHGGRRLVLDCAGRVRIFPNLIFCSLWSTMATLPHGLLWNAFPDDLSHRTRVPHFIDFSYLLYCNCP